MRKRARWIALVFLIVALLLFALGFWEGRSGEVLVMPIPLTPGAKVERDFTVPFTENYDVSVRFSRVLPHEQLTELLSGDNVIDAKVSENGRVITARKYFPPPRPSPSPYALAPENPTSDIGNLAFSNDWIAQIIIAFSAQRGQQYHLSCNVLRTDADLLKTNPIVTIGESDTKARLVPTALFLLGGVAAILCALICGGIYLFRDWRK